MDMHIDPKPNRLPVLVGLDVFYRQNNNLLSCLRSEFNSWSQIAADLGVSRQTIYNRRRELGFSTAFENFTTISNADLDTVVTEELEAFPRTGETNVIAQMLVRALETLLAPVHEILLVQVHKIVLVRILEILLVRVRKILLVLVLQILSVRVQDCASSRSCWCGSARSC